MKEPPHADTTENGNPLSLTEFSNSFWNRSDMEERNLYFYFLDE